jgi:replicative DNA helicase
MALNILLHTGKFSGKTVVFFSLEMSREQLAMRLISSEAVVDNKKLVTGKLGDEDWDKIALASAALGRSKILIDDNPSLSVADMNAKCRRVDNLGLVVIDYLQLMQSAAAAALLRRKPPAGGVRHLRALKIMAKELNVPVVCLSQLSRGPESRTDKRPMLSDCGSPAPSSRTPTSSCSSTGTTTTTRIPRGTIWPSASSPKTAR